MTPNLFSNVVILGSIVTSLIRDIISEVESVDSEQYCHIRVYFDIAIKWHYFWEVLIQSNTVMSGSIVMSLKNIISELENVDSEHQYHARAYSDVIN